MYWFRTHLAPIIMNQNLAIICVTAYSVYIIDTSSAFPAVVRCTLHSDDSAILQVMSEFELLILFTTLVLRFPFIIGKLYFVSSSIRYELFSSVPL